MNVKARSAYMVDLINKDRNLTVPWFLMTSWLYYHHDITLVTDTEFDVMTRLMIEHWDTIEHRHKQLITRGMLGAGTAFNLRDEDYPEITKSAASHLAKEDKHVRWEPRARVWVKKV